MIAALTPELLDLIEAGLDHPRSLGASRVDAGTLIAEVRRCWAILDRDAVSLFRTEGSTLTVLGRTWRWTNGAWCDDDDDEIADTDVAELIDEVEFLRLRNAALQRVCDESH